MRQLAIWDSQNREAFHNDSDYLSRANFLGKGYYFAQGSVPNHGVYPLSIFTSLL